MRQPLVRSLAAVSPALRLRATQCVRRPLSVRWNSTAATSETAAAAAPGPAEDTHATVPPGTVEAIGPVDAAPPGPAEKLNAAGPAKSGRYKHLVVEELIGRGLVENITG